MGGFTPSPVSSPGGTLAGLASSIGALANATAIDVVAHALLDVADAVALIGSALDDTVGALNAVAAAETNDSAVIGALGTIVILEGAVLKDVQSTTGKITGALHLFHFGDIWEWMKKAWDYYRRFGKWYQDHILAPMQRMRAQILKIYRDIFKPVIQVLDSVRVATRIIAVFNRKLAGRIDSALFRLEAKILYPITETLRRLNGLNSILYAVITRTGRLDASVFMATVVRHIGELRAALLGLPWRNQAPSARQPTPAQIAELNDATHHFLGTATPLDDQLAEMDRIYQETFLSLE